MRLALVLLCAAAGCTTEGGRPVFIYQNQAPEEGCIFSTTGTTFIQRGRIDVQASSGYLFAPLVQNNAMDLEGNPGARLALVQGADVAIEVPENFFGDGAEPPENFEDDANFSVFVSGTVDPDGGRTSFNFITLPKTFMTTYLEGPIGVDPVTVQTTVTMFGELGGGSFEAVPFHYAIEVCDGCMLIEVGACADLSTDFMALPGGECNTLQDVPLECCRDAADALVCPAVAPPPA